MLNPTTVGDCTGSSAGVNTEQNGVATPNNPHQTLNFTGDVTVTDAGGGVATIQVGTGPGGRQAFIYTATGLETDTFNVAIPNAPRTDTNYAVIAADGGRADGNLTSFTSPVASYTVNQFQVKAQVAPAVGDKIIFVIQELTS